MATPDTCDIAILGGGLSGCLIALALAEKQSLLDVRLIEAGEQLGGNHIWSFFDSDLAPEDRWLVEPLICHRWDGYDVAFPKHSRTMDAVYNSIRSPRLDAVVRNRINHDKIMHANITTVSADEITLSDGRVVKPARIIDARGPGDISTLNLGWQKFVGLEIHVPGGHGLTRPTIMDATVEQIDGYRFVYCLPFDAETVFIEDTYYSDTPELDVAAIRERIITYANSKGWHTNGGGHEETGVLPVVWGGDFDAYWASTGQDNAKAGLRAGLFHATTGYSLPDAVRLACRYAESLPDAATSRALAKAHWQNQGYFRLLGKMLFNAAEPGRQYSIFERFYTLSPALIARFYAGKLTWADKLRILSGKPPVPILRAIGAIMGKRT
jgi:lycopene beta-cyclase